MVTVFDVSGVVDNKQVVVMSKGYTTNVQDWVHINKSSVMEVVGVHDISGSVVGDCPVNTFTKSG